VKIKRITGENTDNCCKKPITELLVKKRIITVENNPIN